MCIFAGCCFLNPEKDLLLFQHFFALLLVYKVFVPARKNFLALSGTGFSVVRMNFEILKNQRNTFICVALIAKDGFLSYYPLKQGLKQLILSSIACPVNYFYPTIH